MAEIRVKFDTVEVDNPDNWRDISIRYQRDAVFNGLYTKFSNVLSFVGTAYDAIQTAITAGVCTEIAVLIEWRCSRFESFTTLIEGVIAIRDIEIDVDNCTASAQVEEDSCIGQFLKLFDKPVDFNAPLSIDGSASMTSPVVLINDMFAAYNLVTNTYASLGWDDVYGIDAYDGFAYYVKYLTNDCLSFTSDFFTTAYQEQIVRLDFTADPADGENIILECTDDFTGIKYKYQAEYKTGLGVSPYQIVRDNFVSNTTVPDDGAYIYSNGICGVDWSTPGGGVNARYDLTFHMPTTITSFTYGTGTATQTTTQTFVSGGKNMHFSSDKLFRDITPQDYGTISVTFADFYNFFQKTFDLGMSFEESGGTWYLRIEPSEYYLDTTSSLTIRDIKGASITYDEDRLINSVGIGTEYQKYLVQDAVTDGLEDGGKNEEFYGTRYPTLTTDCGTFEDRSVDPDYYHLLGAKMNTSASDTEELPDQYYLIHCYESGGNIYPIDFRIDVYDITVLLAYYRLVVYNRTTSWVNQLYFHAYTLPGIDVTAYDSTILTDTVTRTGVYGAGPPYTFTVANATLGDVTIAEGDGYMNRIWEFTRYISKTDFDSIVNTRQITVNTGSDVADDTTAFIEDMIHNVFTGETQFRLLSK